MAVVIAGVDDFGVGFVDCGFLGEFFLEMVFCAFERAVKQPADQTECKDVAAFQHGFVVETAVGQRGFGHRRYGHFEHLGGNA